MRTRTRGECKRMKNLPWEKKDAPGSVSGQRKL